MRAFKQLSYFFLPVPFAAVAVAQERSIRIGYPECAAATNYPKVTAEKISKLKWYFAHASVGANMMDGVVDYIRADRSTYPFESISGSKTPPDMLSNGY